MLRQFAPQMLAALAMLPAAAMRGRMRTGFEKRGHARTPAPVHHAVRPLPRPREADEEEEAASACSPERQSEIAPASASFPPHPSVIDRWAPEVADVLVRLGYPPDLDRDLPPRAPDHPAFAAKRFLVFLLATSDDTAIARMRSADVERHYREFCRLDHRLPAAVNFVLGALRKIGPEGGVRKEVVREFSGGLVRDLSYWSFERVDLDAVPVPEFSRGGRPKGVTGEEVKRRRVNARRREREAEKRERIAA